MGQNPDTVNVRISTRGAYSIFFDERGALIRRGSFFRLSIFGLKMTLSFFAVTQTEKYKISKKRCSKFLFVKLETLSRRFRVGRHKCIVLLPVLTMRLPS